MLLPTAVLLCLTTSCRDVHDPAGVQRPDLIPAYVITEDSLELFPDADRYDSSSGTPSTGTETTLPLTKDRRPMLRWDSAGLADAIGSDSLIEAFLDLTIVSYDGGWGGQGKQVGVYKSGTGWTETGGFLPPSECTPLGISDSSDLPTADG